MHVAVSGKIASGKDSAAKILMTLLKGQSIKSRPIKFADALYQLCARYDDTREWSPDGWEPARETTLQEKHYITAVFFNQLLCNGTIVAEEISQEICDRVTDIAHHTPTKPGQKNRDRLREVAEYCRAAIAPDFWVRISAQQFNSGTTAGYAMIFSDLRTTPEVHWCEQVGIPTLRIDVDPEVQKARMLALGMRYSEDIINFPTETMLDDYAFTRRIENNGTWEELYENITDFLRSLQSKTAVAS